MLDTTELSKYFNKQQQEDMIALETLCLLTPPGRIRRARVRKIRPDHIPRPVNSFMAYRTEKQSIIRQFCPTANHRDISKMVARWWHNVNSSEKAIFVNKAKMAKETHNKQYPDYTFRPKAKRLDKKNVTKKKDSVVAQSVTDTDNHSSSARSRIFAKPVKSHVSSAINDTFNNCATPVNSSTIYNAGSIETNMTYGTGYNNFMNSNAMYSDDVLFKASESSNFWDTTFQSSDQVMSSAYPSLVGSQTNYYGMPMPYYPNLITPVINPTPAVQDRVGAIDPLVTMMPSSSSYNPASFTQGNVGYMNIDGQLYPRLDCQVTPQSQILSTPRLGYHGSPLSPNFDYEESLPTDVLSPFISPNSEFISWPSNIKYEDPNLLGDCDFWNNGIN
ncbi:hypothetical protein BDF21DRAFT_493653 [Thamnidium elegans]|nr:hypothetical protein BDF21DRAFT_493653 [Thamnidium elegans]